MKRILLIGSGGSGKSTLAQRLGDILHLPVIHLDQQFWRSGWTETPKEEFKEKVNQLVSLPEWVMDGNFKSNLPHRLPYADTVILLDFSPWICGWRLFKRIWKYSGKTRPDLTEGCLERFHLGFFLWVINYPRNTKPIVMGHLKAMRPDQKLVILKSPKEVEKFCQSIEMTG